MFNLRLPIPLAEISIKYTIRAFTILKKLTFPRGGEGDIHINFVDEFEIVYEYVEICFEIFDSLKIDQMICVVLIV